MVLVGLMICIVMSKACEDYSVESFDLSVGLQEIIRCRQVLDSQSYRYGWEEL